MTRAYRTPERNERWRSVVKIVSASVGGAAILIALTTTEGYGRSAAAEPAPATPVVTLVPEDIATVERRDLGMGTVIAGTLTPRRHATVRAEVGGSVLAVYADRGTEVAAGAPLERLGGRALLDAQVAAASDVRADEEAVTLAKRRLTRTEILVTGGAIAADEADNARQELTSAEARLAASKARYSAATEALARTLVRAPFGGVVSARPVNHGDIVESGNVLFEILDPTTMYVETSVPAAEIGSIRVGLPVEFTVTGYAARTFSGRIERVNPAADPTTRQVPVFVAIDNGDGRLVAGLFAEGRVAPSAGPTLILPGAAVERNGSAATVVRFAAGHIERRSVQVGRKDADGDFVEIVTGVSLGDTVVVGVSRSLPTGAMARIADAKSVAAAPIAR